MTDASRWTRAQDLFLALLELPPEQRAERLRTLAGDDAGLRTEVEALLAGHAAAAADFLEPPAEPAAAGAGARIGACRLVRQLGEGAMGTVWLARDESLGRDVAVKVLHGGVLGRSALARFEQEATVLARLRHPSIAAIFATGRTGDGPLAPPYFVLELVEDAQPITEYCQRTGAGREQRATLLAQVADAVQHAHQRGVVHRDLKPANVLVGRDGVPKVIDFGIARLADDADTRVTRAGQVLGTPAWLSPEQCLGDPDLVDARTDVHALGALGCELLAGAGPYDVVGLSLPAALQRIAHEQPRDPRRLRPALPHDLVAVLSKACRKDPGERHATAAAFADDLRAFLAHRPVSAAPPQLAGTIRLFVRRSPGLAAALALAGTSLVAGIAVSTHFAIQAADRAAAAELARTAAEEQTRVAERDRAAAQDLADALREIVRAGNLALTGREVTMREALDAAAATIATRFARNPAVAVELQLSLGDAYRVLGRLPEAEQQLAGAAALLPSLPGDRRDVEARHAVVLAALRVAQNRPEAMALFDRAVATFRELGGEGHRSLPETRMRRGAALVGFGRANAAEPDLRAAIAGLAGAGPSLSLADGQANLGVACFEQGRLREAEAAWREGLALYDAVVPADHPHRVKVLGNLVNVLRTRAPADAVALAREVVQITAARFPDGHTDTAQARAQLAWALLELGDPSAEAEFAAVIALRERLQGAAHAQTQMARTDLGYCLLALQRPADAIAPLVAAFAALPQEPPTAATAGAALLLGLARARTGDGGAAEPLLRLAVDARCRLLGPDNVRTHMAKSALGECLLGLGRTAEAQPLLIAAEAALVQALGPDHRETKAASERLAALRARPDR